MGSVWWGSKAAHAAFTKQPPGVRVQGCAGYELDSLGAAVYSLQRCLWHCVLGVVDGHKAKAAFDETYVVTAA